MLMKKIIVASLALLLLMSLEAAAETSSRVSPERTRQSLDAHMPALKSLFPNLQGVAVDRESGAAVLTLLDLKEKDVNVASKQSSAQKLLAVPVRIKVIRAPIKQQ